MPRPTLTLVLRNFDADPQPPSFEHILQLAVAAERAGIDRVVAVDHLVMGENIEAYDGGVFPTGPDGSWLEPLTVLAVVAGRTSRVRLATGILIAPLRPAAVLAKTTATLDVLSGGRLELGVGVGWQREEYEAVGLDFARRGRMLDETLGACRALWREMPANFSSAGITFRSTWCQPKPMQAGGIPIWVGGRLNVRTLDRIVRFADGWIPWGDYTNDVQRGINELRPVLEAAGRDPLAFEVRGGMRVHVDDGGSLDLDRTFEPIPELLAGGVTDLAVGYRMTPDIDKVTEELAAIVEGFDVLTGRPPSPAAQS